MWVRYGIPAAEALREEIARTKGSEPLAPVTVVVPSNQVGVSTRRLLASGRVGPVCGTGTGLIGVTFVTPYRLAELLGAAHLAAQGRRPVSTPVLGAAVRRALTDEPGSFGPVAQHAATEAALVDAHRELRDLDDAACQRLAASSERAAEVVRVHRAAQALLADDWYDEEDLMAAAVEAVAAGQGPSDLGAVIVHLPQRLTRHAAELLRALGSASELRVLAGATGDPKADAEVRQSVERLGVPLGPPPSEVHLPVEAGRTRIVTASDADDEVRAAVRAVVDAVRAGTSLDRIAVLYAAKEPYARLVEHHLAAAGVARNGTATQPVAGRAAGRTLLQLLHLPAGGWKRADVFAWLTGSPIPAPTARWERASRAAGVVGGRTHWDLRLQGDEPAAAELRGFLLPLIDRLEAAEAPAPWGERAAWARALVADLLGGARARLGWPDEERRAAERLDLALDRLAALDHLEGPVGLDVFTRALENELEADLGRVGRFGQGVLVGPVSMGVGVDLDLVVLVGMAEGTFPSTVRDDSLLPDDDRGAVPGSLPLRSGHVDRLHHQFLATVAGAEQQLLCVPRGDLRRSRDRVPSRWVLSVASQLAGETWWSAQLLGGQAPWLTHHASFDAALRRAEPATHQEHRLRSMLAQRPEPDPLVTAGEAVVAERAGPTIGRFDGNLGGLAIPSPVEHGTSATALETWARCPHRYLLEHVLRVRPVEQPEDVLRISPLDTGLLFHAAVDEFLAEAIAEGTVPDPATPWPAAARDRLQQIGEAWCQRVEADGLTGRELLWGRDRQRILAELQRFLTADDRHRAANGATPIFTELPFGRDGRPAIEFPLSDGRTVPLRGKADRVDRTTDGTLIVLDYKTGKADRYRALSADDPHQGGTHLQLAVYGVAARQAVGEPHAPVRAAYWFTSTAGRWETIGYRIDEAVLASVSEAVTFIVDGIDAGWFAPNPPEPSTRPWPECPWCDPDGLGTAELRRRWERKLEHGEEAS